MYCRIHRNSHAGNRPCSISWELDIVSLLSPSSPFLFGRFLCIIISTSLSLLDLSGLLHSLGPWFPILKRVNLIGCCQPVDWLDSGQVFTTGPIREGEDTWCKHSPLDPSFHWDYWWRREAVSKRRLWIGQEFQNVSIVIIILYNCAKESF